LIASKLPRRLAIVGVAIGFAFWALWWYDLTYNPFHMPTTEQLQGHPYDAPPLYSFLENLMYALFPGLVVRFFGLGAFERHAWVVWVVAALFNGAIYYCGGLVITGLIGYVSRRSQRTSKGSS